MKDYILGVDLGGTNIKAAAYRLGSYEKVGEKRLPTQVEGGWEHVLGRVLAALEELLRQTPGTTTSYADGVNAIRERIRNSAYED